MQPLYNRDGRAIAYITDNGVSIYLYDGEAAGWVFQESLVFAYSGKFLGWFMYGWLCDPAGNPAFFTDRSSGGPKRPARQTRPLRAPRGARPPRRQRQVRPSRPGMTQTWSSISDESFFATSPSDPVLPIEDDATATEAATVEAVPPEGTAPEATTPEATANPSPDPESPPEDPVE